jgi:polygalacturonase
MSFHECTVTEYGAVGDGRSLCTDAIQKAIETVAEKGGGAVVLPEGVYRTGALFVRSGVELRITKGATLQAVQDDSMYPELWTRYAGIEMYAPSALINVCSQDNVKITGKGTIDGNGEYWWDKFWGQDEQGGMLKEYTRKNLRWAVDYDCKRPRLLMIWNSSNIAIEGLTLERSPFWTVHIAYSTKVAVDGVVIRRNAGPSTDGINVDSSSDVLIENCDIDCNDDNICMKSGRDADGLRINRPTENVVIRNCITRSGHGMFTIGSDMSGGVRNVEVYNMKALGTWIGISIKSARTRGGLVDNIAIHDVEMVNVSRPFRFILNWFPKFSYTEIPSNWQGEIPEHWKTLCQPVVPRERGIPEFKNISIANVSVKSLDCVRQWEASSPVRRPPVPLTSQAFDVDANPEKPIRNVRWANIEIEADEAGRIGHARDWTMTNVSVRTPEGTPVLLDHCTNVQAPKVLHAP